MHRQRSAGCVGPRRRATPRSKNVFTRVEALLKGAIRVARIIIAVAEAVLKA